MKQNKEKNRSLKNTSKGFTLIELIITVIAIGIFGAITANILGNASKVYSKTLNKQKFVSEVRSSFFRLNRDINLQTWPTNDDISSSKTINIKGSDNWESQYNFQSNNKLRLNLIQHPNLNPTSQILSEKINFSSSNIYYYDNQNSLVTNNSDANSVSFNRLSILFDHPIHGYSMNLDSYISPYNFQFGKPMDYHE